MRLIETKKRLLLIIILIFCLYISLISVSNLAHSESEIKIKKGWMTESGPDWECHCPVTLYWDCVCIYNSQN